MISRPIKPQRGATLVEAAFAIPIFLYVICFFVDLCLYLYTTSCLHHAAERAVSLAAEVPDLTYNDPNDPDATARRNAAFARIRAEANYYANMSTFTQNVDINSVDLQVELPMQTGKSQSEVNIALESATTTDLQNDPIVVRVHASYHPITPFASVLLRTDMTGEAFKYREGLTSDRAARTSACPNGGTCTCPGNKEIDADGICRCPYPTLENFNKDVKFNGVMADCICQWNRINPPNFAGYKTSIGTSEERARVLCPCASCEAGGTISNPNQAFTGSCACQDNTCNQAVACDCPLQRRYGWNMCRCACGVLERYRSYTGPCGCECRADAKDRCENGSDGGPAGGVGAFDPVTCTCNAVCQCQNRSNCLPPNCTGGNVNGCGCTCPQGMWYDHISDVCRGGNE